MYPVKFLVLSSLLAGGWCAKTEVINSAVDRLLEEAKKELSKQGRDRLEIEDLRHSFNKTWLSMDFQCWLHCLDGWVEPVSSARRIGDATLSGSGTEMALQLAMGLSEIRVEFGTCTFGVKNLFKVTSLFKGHATKVVLEAAIRLRVNDTSKECTASLDRLELVRAEEVEINTGGNIFQQLRDRLFSRLINHDNSRTARVLSNHLREIVREYFLMERLCDTFSYRDRTTPRPQNSTTLA